MDAYFKLILGSTPLTTFLAAYTFALVGIFVSLQAHANSRDIPSPATPVNFSYKFLALDNLIRLVSSAITVLLTLFIMIRFSVELLGTALSMLSAFGIGFGYDKAFQSLKNASLQINSKIADLAPIEEMPATPPVV